MKGSEPMRIEKINDKQIRCTLNQKDLSDREIRISELAYGTDKAKALFRDMMQQASYEFGFEADNIPLMIEAIPMYPDTLVLVITKVDDPDELDTRFSTFSDTDDLYELENEYNFDADEIDDSNLLDNFDYPEYGDDDAIPFNINTDDNNSNDDFISLSDALSNEPRPETPDKKIDTDIIKLYSFDELKDICQLADNIKDIYSGQNTLYKDSVHDKFYLVLHQSDMSPTDYNKICTIISEYGKTMKNMYASHSYFEEHYEPFIKDNALQVLATI